MSNIRRVGPLEAYREICDNPSSRLIDVRDSVEFAFVGYPLDAVNIPLKLAPEMSMNPKFLEKMREVVEDPSVPVYLLCRSGQRSLAAAELLSQAGYLNLVNIEEGFEGALDEHQHRSTINGWRFHGLPWRQG